MERIDDLQNKNLKIIQNKEWFCFGIDSILLSDFSKKIKSSEKLIDLGCGNGILELLLCKKTKAEKIIGVEVQSELSELAIKNIKLNKLENKVEIINNNIKNLKKHFKPDTFDAVISNPPYMKKDTGKLNENKVRFKNIYFIDSILFYKTNSNLLTFDDICVIARDWTYDSGNLSRI